MRSPKPGYVGCKQNICLPIPPSISATKENDRFEHFLQQATAIDDTFKCYDDALAFVIACRQNQQRQAQYDGPEFYKIVSYSSAANDLKACSHLQSDLVILDEAQRIESDYLTVLTGTPLENKLEELYSIVQYIDPYCLGPYYKFLSEKDSKRLLLTLSQMRMVADSTFILDQTTRFDTKVDELMNIIHEMIENGDEKAVVFSQWERMTRLVAQELDKAGIPYRSLHGSIPSEKRKYLITDFNEDPLIRVFLSTDAGSTGLNLQSASLIVNLDIPWNPAVLEQRIARILPSLKRIKRQVKHISKSR